MKAFVLALGVASLFSPAFASDPTVDSLLDKARILRQSGKPQEAKPVAEKAMMLAEQQSAWQLLVRARTELSFEERFAGDYDRVLQLRLANLDTVRAHPEAFAKDGPANALESVCAAYSWKRNYPLAIRYCREGLAAVEAVAEKASPGLDVPRSEQRLGINLYLAGQYAEAQELFQSAYRNYAAWSTPVNQPQAAWTYEPQVEVLRWLERTLVAQKHFDQALETSELGRSRALAATMARGTSNRAIAVPSVEEIRAMARTRGATIVEYSVLYDYDPDLLFIFSNFEDTPVASIYCWVIELNGKITFHESGVPSKGSSLVEMVRQARSSVGAYGRGLTLVSASERPAGSPLKDLYSLLIAPVNSDLPRNPNQVVTFVLQDWLFMVPFAALQDNQGHYFIEQHAISVTPSVGVLELTHQEFASPRVSGGALVVGNPAMPSLALKPGEVAQPLMQLPGAEREATAVADRFHATALVGTLATKEQVLRQLPNAEVVHLATHGLLDQATSGYQSALALAPASNDNGFLTMREIQDLKLNADLVVLSACDTALGKMSGDGILGLSRSFLTAGTPSVVVSLWAISDDSTAYLMQHFYGQLQAGQDKARSLRSAMLDTMQKYPSPLNWAAFTLIGETAVAPDFRNIHGDPKAMSANQAKSSVFVPPLPPDVSDLREDPDPNFGGAVSSATYSTHMSVAELVQFYKRELENRGLKEVANLERLDAKGFTLVYRGPWADRELVIGGSDFAGARTVGVRFEPLRN